MANGKQIEKILRVWTGKTGAAISLMLSPNEEIIQVCIINADGSMSAAETRSFDELADQIRATEYAEDAVNKIGVMN